jgi:hypothetical protein
MFYLGATHVSHLYCKCFIRVLYMFHTYVASVLSGCYICFTLMLQVFHPDVAYAFNTCFPCVSDVYVAFQLFQMYIANVSSRCCKSRSDVAHIVVAPISSSYLLQLLGPPSCERVWRGREQQAWDTKHMRPWCGRRPWYVLGTPCKANVHGGASGRLPPSGRPGTSLYHCTSFGVQNRGDRI